MAKDKLQQLSDELEETMEYVDRAEADLAPYKEKIETTRKQLVEGMLKKGYQYIKTSSGMGFGIVQGRKTYLIKKGKEQEAINWASAQYPGLLTLNKSDLAKVLKPMLQVPEFFEEKIGEPHLSVRTSEEE